LRRKTKKSAVEERLDIPKARKKRRMRKANTKEGGLGKRKRIQQKK